MFQFIMAVIIGCIVFLSVIIGLTWGVQYPKESREFLNSTGNMVGLELSTPRK